jgi:predicted CDP-diglyceride synthetase/phosphatidate cytidylyltransferase
MKTLIYACMSVNVGAAVFLFFSMFSNGQDAAGNGMVFLPILLLLVCSAASYFLMQAGHYNWALVISGFPVIILAYLLFISVT